MSFCFFLCSSAYCLGWSEPKLKCSIYSLFFKTGLATEDLNKIRKKRRTLKNRNYAKKCLEKRGSEEEALKAELAKLKVESSIVYFDIC